MEKQLYESKIFYMGIDPDTNKKTIRLEVELDNTDFDTIKKKWIKSDELDIHIRHE